MAKTVTTTKSAKADAAKSEPKDDDKAPRAKLTVDPELTSIGAPVRIRAEGIRGDIRADHVGQHGIGQTLTPDHEGIVLATFQHSGEVEIKAKRAHSSGWVTAKLVVR